MGGVAFSPLPRIAVTKGDVLHGLKQTDVAYAGFGEAYFTSIYPGAIKGWRRHRSMVLNLIVPVGAVRFAASEWDGAGSQTNTIEVFDLSDAAGGYGRLTVSAGVWLAFQGVGEGLNLILNIASIPHDPSESETRELDAFPGAWAL